MRTAYHCYARRNLALPLAILRPRCITPSSTRQSWFVKTGSLSLPAPPQAASFSHASWKRAKESPNPLPHSADRLPQIVAGLDKYLTPAMRYNEASIPFTEVAFNAADVLALHRDAGRAGTELWGWMIDHGKRKTVVFILKSLLAHVAHSSTQEASDQVLSNLTWLRNPSGSIDTCAELSEYKLPIGLTGISSLESILDQAESFDSSPQIIRHVWRTLLRFIQLAAKVPEGETSEHMSVVLLTIGTLHQYGLIPDRAYSYKPAPWSSYLKRPPILHVVSSRILTSLSDAAWRDQQDDAIAEATKSGMSLKELGESVPGGRFRLRVRPLPVEIWLEFILWCSLELGEPRAVADTILNLNEEDSEPWFAVRWCSPVSSDSNNDMVDWDGLKLRYGGSVGLIEGYSREKPFVDVPRRTVSVELVLATIDQALAKLSLRHKTTKHQRRTILRPFVHDIQRLVAFLEPHDLSASYFDYLAHRTADALLPAAQTEPLFLQSCLSGVAQLRSLQKQDTMAIVSQDLQLYSVQENTVLQNAIQHQVLEALMQQGILHSALTVFNDIQEVVDRNKLRSIAGFLQETQRPSRQSFFISRASQHRLEYVDSHGQLPYHKLAGFLDLVTSAKLPGLGEWLLYSDDLDGPMIPSTAYSTPSLIPALVRFASSNNDHLLFSRVVIASRRAEFKPTIRMYRAIINADIIFSRFSTAKARLDILKQVQGGGYPISTLASLAAVILRYENNQPLQDVRKLKSAEKFMHQLLSGQFDAARDDYSIAQRGLFKQQVSHMLRLFNACEGSILRTLARRHVHRFVSGNQACLPPRSFNVFFSAYADTHGLSQSLELYTKFCGETVDDVNFDDHLVDQQIDFPTTADSILEAQTKYNETEPAKSVVHASQNLESDARLPSDLTDSPFFRTPIIVPAFEDDAVGAPEVSRDDVSEIVLETAAPRASQELPGTPSPYLEPIHSVIPTLETLRILTQAWVHEHSGGITSDSYSKTQKRRLNRIRHWLVCEYAKFGFDRRSVDLSNELETVVAADEPPIFMAGARDSKASAARPSPQIASLWQPQIIGTDFRSEREALRKERFALRGEGG